MQLLPCPNCSNMNPVNSRFCSACGHSFTPNAPNNRTQVYAHTTTGANAPAGGSDSASAPHSSRSVILTEQAHSQFIDSTANPAHQHEQTVLTIDNSSSMDLELDGSVRKIEAAVRAGSNLLVTKGMIDANDEIGIVSFNTEGEIVAHLQPIVTGRRDLITALQGIQAGGGTDLNEGLLCAERLFDWSRSDVVRRIIMLTDGQGGDPVKTAKQLKDRGVVIDVIGVGPTPAEVEEKLLRKIASVIGGEVHYRFIKDHQSLLAHYTELAQKTRTC